MPIVRKILSIFFAGLILFNLSGYYFVFKCDQIRIKTGMKTMIRNGSFPGSCEEITILNPASDRNFRMLDKDEILYRGKLYDVISTRISGTSVIFRCINDTKEEKLLAGFEKYSKWITGMNLPERNRNSQAMLNHIIKHALLNKFSLQHPSTSYLLLFFEPPSDLNSIAIQPSIPPPRFA